jgi:serine/threonine protein kinase
VGLQYLHDEAKIIYLDIKPENILIYNSVDGDRIFKLIDFKFLNNVFYAKTACGSPIFIIFEIYYTKTQTPKLDIFALGVVILGYSGVFDKTEFRLGVL